MTAPSIPIRRLLILSCSATKRPEAGYIPARLRYDGPFWRTLRAVDPDGTRASVAFLSARYGFRDADTSVQDYDARLTQDLAERMIAGGMTTRWPRPRRRDGPDNAGVHPGTEIASMARYGREPFADVALVGGGPLSRSDACHAGGVPAHEMRVPACQHHHDQRSDRSHAAGSARLAA